MPTRTAQAAWEGDIRSGQGTISVQSGRLESPYSFGSRFQDGPGTNPEELLGAAAAGCFTMALALALTELGHPPTRIDTTASVGIEKAGDGFRIPRIDLRAEAAVPGIDAETFLQQAEAAKADCPVSFLKERLVSRGCSSKRSSILPCPGPPRPDRARAPAPRRGQGRPEPPKGSLDADACRRTLGKVEMVRYVVVTSSSRRGGHRCAAPVRAMLGGHAADADAGHSCVLEAHGVLRATARRDQSIARPRRRSGGP